MSDSTGHDRIEARLDRELSFRGITVFGIGLALFVILVGAFVWGLSSFLKRRLEASDARPPLLPEARIAQPPPEPRLQARPSADLQEFLRRQEALLESYAWVDAGGGVARIPVERAVEIALEQGFDGRPLDAANRRRTVGRETGSADGGR